MFAVGPAVRTTIGRTVTKDKELLDSNLFLLLVTPF